MWGNTLYRLSLSSGTFNYYFNDLGGYDTLVLDYDWRVPLYIDLRAGFQSKLGVGQVFTVSPTFQSAIERVVLGQGNDLLVGNDVSNVFHGQGGNDTIWGMGGNDFIDGSFGHDVLVGGVGDDQIDGGLGSDRIFGESGHDIMQGGVHNDTIYGGAGNDTIAGQLGADVLYGEGGSDTFVFQEVVTYSMNDVAYPMGESDVNARDTIVGFDGVGVLGGDVIDLSLIDASSFPALFDPNDSFVFLGTSVTWAQTFNWGYIWLSEEGTNTIVHGNTLAGFNDEFQIVIVDGAIRASQYTVNEFAL